MAPHTKFLTDPPMGEEMKPTALCVVCDHPARTTETDQGNSIYVECTNLTCGDYTISKRAARTLAGYTYQKTTLKDLAFCANGIGKVLEIATDESGQVHTTSTKRGYDPTRNNSSKSKLLR